MYGAGALWGRAFWGALALSACSKSAAPGPGDGAAPDLSGDLQGDVGGGDDAAPGATVTCNGASLRAGQSAGNCKVLIAGLALDTHAFAVGGGNLYYGVGTEIRRMSTAGGPAQTVTTVPATVIALSADATNLYFVTLNRLYARTAVVGYVPLAGGAAHILTSGADSPIAVAADATDVYWASDGTSLAVHRIAIAGGSIVDIGFANFTGRTIAVDATNFYWISNSSVLGHAKATAGTDISNGVSAGEMTMAQGVYGSVAADDGYVYFTGHLSGSWGLSRLSKASGSSIEDLDGSNGGALAIDGANVYYATGTNQVVRYQTASHTSQLIATAGDNGPIAVDATSVYEYLPARSEGGPSGIVKIAK